MGCSSSYTFRINLKNGQDFYLIYTPKSWIAQVEGKKFYLLNLNEEQNACESIARILRYGSKAEAPVEGTEAGATETATDIEVEEPAAEA